jgi:subtilase family serine protease
MPFSSKSAAILLLSVGATLFSFAQDRPANRIAQAIDRSQSVIVPGSAHPLAQANLDMGRVAGSLPLNGVSLVFKPSPAQQSALELLLREQQDRSSPNYHKWLTPEQYADRFGITAQDIAKVSAWLRSEGFTPGHVARSRTQISFAGTAAQVEAVFHTQLHHYLIDGEMHFSNATEVSVPAAIAGTVRAVRNLSSLRPQGHYTNNGAGAHSITPDDFATIYNLLPLYQASTPLDGTGQTIVVIGQTEIYHDPVNNIYQDIDAFRTAANLPARTSTNFVEHQVPNSGVAAVNTNYLTDADIGLEWSQAVARGANIVYVFVGNDATSNAFNALQYAIDQNYGSVITINQGACEANPVSEATTVQLWAQQANAYGQTIVAAAGDEGAADCDGKVASATMGLAVDVPASVPEVTGVGGTEFTGDPDSITTTTYWLANNSATGESAISYIPEIVWNDTLANGVLSAGGGGASTVFSKPSWQIGTNVPADGMRDVPDISFSASSDHDPYLLCSGASNFPCVNGYLDSNNKVNTVGGTSVGAPEFAGLVAIINQATNSRQGNVNPTLYSLAASSPQLFHDIDTGSNNVPCTAGSPDCPASGNMGFVADTGYDQASGLGSVDANALVNAWPIDFSIAADPNRVNIAAPGAQGTSTLTLNPVYNFAGTVSLTCTPQSGVAGLTCSISPATVTPASPTATLTISTVGPGVLASARPPSGFGWLLGSSVTLFAGCFMINLPCFRRRRIFAMGFFLFAMLTAGVGCGGGGSSTSHPPGTPSGNYTITINATSAGVTYSTTVTAGVQ